MKYIKLLLSVVFVSAQFLLSAQNQTKDLSSESKAAFQKLSAVYYLINNFYVDTADFEKLTEEAIVTMLKDKLGILSGDATQEQYDIMRTRIYFEDGVTDFR